MDREVLLLQQLQRNLTGWCDCIRRATGALEVRIEHEKSEGISIVGTWKNNGTAANVHKKIFAPSVLFGPSLLLPPSGRHLVMRPCECARAYIQEILQLRGIIK